MSSRSRSEAVRRAFGGDDEESTFPDDGLTDIQRVNREFLDTPVESFIPDDEDASAYDYDSHYDSLKAEEEQKRKAQVAAQTSTTNQKSRYISELLTASKLRDKERERAFERRLKREQEAEEAEFGKTEKFVTSAYKQKLLEEERWEAQERAQEEYEEAHDARHVGMAAFYSGLNTRNISLGSSVEHSVSAFTSGGAANTKLVSSSAQNEAKSNEQKSDSRKRSSEYSSPKKRGDYHDRKNERTDNRDRRRSRSRSRERRRDDSRGRRRDDSRGRRRDDSRGRRSSPSRDYKRSDSRDRRLSDSRKSRRSQSRDRKRDTSTDTSYRQSSALTEDIAVSSSPTSASHIDSSKPTVKRDVNAARERFLARKAAALNENENTV